MSRSFVVRLLRRGKTAAGKLRRCSAADWKALSMAGPTVATVAVLLRMLPFRRVQRLLEADPSGPPFLLSEAEEGRLLWAVEAVSRRLLPARPCLTQALAAQVLLQRRGGRPAHLKFGVIREDEGGIQAHAWLERDGSVLLGGTESPQRYNILSTRAE